RRGRRAADVGDALVTELGEVVDGEPSPLLVVDDDHVDALDVDIALPDHDGRRVGGRLGEGAGGGTDAEQHQAVDAQLEERLDRVAFESGVRAAASDQ